MGRTTRAMMLAASCLAAAALGINASDGAFAQGAESQSKTCRVTRAKEVEIQRIEPFKVFDNLYYVGPCYVSVWLLTTPQGHILFDSAQEPFIDDTIENIEKVGVNLRDIKYIILSHGHMDHVGGAERIRRVTGARVVAVEQDWQMMDALQGKSNNRDVKPNVLPKRDMIVKDGETLTLGDQTLKFHWTPGHTPGVLTTEGIKLKDGSQTYTGIVMGGGGYRGGLESAQQSVESAKKVASIKGVQVNLQIHSWAEPNGYPGGGVLERAVLLKNRQPGQPHPFVDANTWNDRAKAAQANALKAVEKEKQKAASGK